MAKRWKNSRMNIEATTQMISHSIVKHPEPVVVQSYYSNNNQAKCWTLEEYTTYIDKIKAIGYEVGRQVELKWGGFAKIHLFRAYDSRNNWHKEFPDIMQVLREDANNVVPSVFYNTNELKLVGEK